MIGPLIAISGSDSGDELSAYALEVAEEIGGYIAERKGVLICGGRGGVMEASARGAKQKGGITIGFLPYEKDSANKFIDIAIPTGLGHIRNFLLVRSADSVIGIAGRWGTLNEISFALNIGKPTVIVKGTGGWIDILSEKKHIDQFKAKPHIASSAKEAVDLAFRLCHL